MLAQFDWQSGRRESLNVRRGLAMVCPAAIACALMAILLATPAAAEEIAAKGRQLYASPQGRPDGEGTRQSPWDLATVLAGEKTAPGDTVWLLSGTYRAPMRDGKPAAFVSNLKGEPGRPVILRAARGARVRLDGWMEVKGAHAWYWGFEIADSGYTEKTAAGAREHGTSINVFGPGTRFINLDVHDGAMGFGAWSPAVDCEIYGCLIHDFGYAAPDRGHGHAVYTQNETGTKRIVDNIMFHGAGWNIHVYGQQGRCEGFHIEGNICFSAGTLVKGQVADNILVSAYTPADRITLVDNYCYHPGGEDRLGGGWRPCVRVDSYGKEVNGTCLVRGNVIAGARGLQVGRWKDATITENLIWGPKVLASVQPPGGDQFKNYRWDKNTYLLTGQTAPMVIGGEKGRIEKAAGIGFDEWKQRTGFDAASQTLPGHEGRPSGTSVYVRPNKYEPGRGHVAVFNWDRRRSVEVDLGKVLRRGARYAMHNVQDPYGKPVAAGVYDGKAVTLPMLMSAIAPEFDAFVVVTRE